MNGPHALEASYFNGHEHPVDTLAGLMARQAELEGKDPSEAESFFRAEAEALVKAAMDQHSSMVFG